jgi:hypothetical protein
MAGITIARNHGHELNSKCTRRSHSGFVIEVCAERHSSVLKISKPECGMASEQRLPELNLVPVRVIDPGKATVGFVHSVGVDLYSLLL